MSRTQQKLDSDAPKPDGFGPASAVIALLVLLCLGPASGRAQAAADLAATNSGASAQGSQGAASSLEGTVLCYDADWHQLFIQGKDGPVFLSPSGLRTDFKAGDRVKITGLSAGRKAPAPAQALILGHGPLPAPRPIELGGLAAAAGAWVEITAPVRLAENSRGRLVLSLGTAGQTCAAYVMGPPPTNDCKEYTGSVVRLWGINTSRIVDGQVAEASLMVPGMSQISVVQPAATRISLLPVVSIDSLLNRELGSWTNLPVHLNGLVSSAIPGESLLLKDPTGMIEARILQVSAVAPGDRIDIWGYLDASSGQPLLKDAYFEPARAPASAPAPADAPSQAASALPGICTSIVDLRSLPREQVAAGLNVRFRGTVVYCDPDWQTAFVHDGEASVYAGLKQTNVAVGQFVELTGRATPGAFAPALLPGQFRILGTTNLPPAIPADVADLADGHLDAQWVEISGVVRNASSQWNHLHLTLMSRKGKFNALVPGFAAEKPPAGLLDSRVLVRGICGSDLNARKQLSGITIYVPNLDQITTLEAAPQDPFDIRNTPIAEVATFDPERIAGCRIKISGVVTLNVPGQGLYLQDNTGGIRVETRINEASQVRAGDAVEVLGFPALGDFSPRLEAPLVRRLASGIVTPATRTKAETILMDGTNDARLVSIDAELLQKLPRSAQPKLVLQQGPIIFTAQMPGSPPPAAAFSWRPGSLIRVTGMCVIQGTEDHNPQSFRILLAGPEGLQLLKAPPTFSLRHLLMLAGSLVCVGLLSLFWILALRRQVHTRTAALRASQTRLQRQFEHTEALAELGRQLNAAATPKDAALIIVEAADRLLGWDCCICDMYSPESNSMLHVLNMDLVDGRRTECQPQFSELPVSSMARRAINEGPQLILREPDEVLADDSIPFGDKTRRSASILYVPIRDGAGVVGVLSIQSYTFHAYTEPDMITLQALADHCSGALSRIRTQQQLVGISRQAGMAEVATGVLHNVGNVLNSVNVSVALLRQELEDSNAAKLTRVAELLGAHSHDLAHFLSEDPKGKKLPGYLTRLAERMTSNEAQARAEFASLSKNVEHIKEIVSMQQSYARVAGVAEPLSAAELVEDALRLNAGTLRRHQIEVCREYPSHLPTLVVDKHKALQILINLIRNAKYACDESGRTDKKLTVGIANGDDRVRISVTDNGVGIPAENLVRIFGLGFSTRKNGHGFGLHSGALAARELGGKLNVRSDGPGTGATFILELPLSASN